MSETGKLYAVPWTVQKFAGDLCWGSCGHGMCGALRLEVGAGVVECIPCRQEQCPHLDRQMDEPIGDVNGEPVYLRKLADPKQKSGGLMPESKITVECMVQKVARKFYGND